MLTDEPAVLLETLICNSCHCPRQGRRGQSLAQLRTVLIRVGWFIDQANDIDLCPTCLAKGVEPPT